MMLVNGYLVEEPASKQGIKKDQRLYIASSDAPDFFTTFYFEDDLESLSNLFKRGVVYTSRKYAIRRAKAMCGINPFDNA